MLDLTNVNASNGKPNGEFTLRLLEMKDRTSQAGNQYISVKLCIVGDSFDKFPVFDMFMRNGKRGTVDMSRLADVMDKLSIPRSVENYTPFIGKTIKAKLREDKDGKIVLDKYIGAAVVENQGETF